MSGPSRISLFKRSNGFYYILFDDEGRRRWKSTGCTLKADALRQLTDFKALLRKAVKGPLPRKVLPRLSRTCTHQQFSENGRGIRTLADSPPGCRGGLYSFITQPAPPRQVQNKAAPAGLSCLSQHGTPSPQSHNGCRPPLEAGGGEPVRWNEAGLYPGEASLKTDEQEATRCLLLSPETTQQKIRQGIEQRAKHDCDKNAFNRLLEVDSGRRLLKDRIRAIKQQHITDIRINKPEEELITAVFLKPRHQRDIGRVVSLVKVFALLNLWWRDRDGSTITANESDVDEAFSVWQKVAESQELSLAPYVYQFYQEIILTAFEKKNQGELATEHKTGLSRKEILQKHTAVYGRSLPIDKLRFEILPQLEASGLIVQESDANDRRNKLVYPTTSYTISQGVVI